MHSKLCYKKYVKYVETMPALLSVRLRLRVHACVRVCGYVCVLLLYLRVRKLIHAPVENRLDCILWGVRNSRITFPECQENCLQMD